MKRILFFVVFAAVFVSPAAPANAACFVTGSNGECLIAGKPDGTRLVMTQGEGNGQSNPTPNERAFVAVMQNPRAAENSPFSDPVCDPATETCV